MIITPFLVIFMGIVFILLFLFLNTVDKRKWLSALISVVLTPIVYFYVFYPFLNIISSYHHQKKFDSSAWVEKPALRYEMIDHTLNTDTLIGHSKNEINALLGTYEWLSWDVSKKTHDEDKWNYGLGTEPGAFNSQKECLQITFSADKVIAVTHYQEELKFDNESQ